MLLSSEDDTQYAPDGRAQVCRYDIEMECVVRYCWFRYAILTCQLNLQYFLPSVTVLKAAAAVHAGWHVNAAVELHNGLLLFTV
ncbi:hypothetical protein KCU99_g247, partial [Aureobasidium melanogenum]